MGELPATPLEYLPVFLRLTGLHALVVGGGPVAARKADWLIRAGARVSVVAPVATPQLAERAARGELTFLAARFSPAHVTGVALVVAATGDARVNAAAARAASAARVPVNVVDQPALSSFIFPAIIDRAPILVAVGSSGRSPVLARRVREQIEALLPARLGALAHFLGERRRAVARALGRRARRAFWERIIGGPAGGRLLAGDLPAAEQAFDRELRAAGLTGSMTTNGSGLGEVYLIGAGPGDPDLLTLRALQLLQQADVILYDRLIPEAILQRARRDAQRIFVGKEAGDHAQQAHIHELLVHLARQGLRVARLKGGDPFVFGRGGEELEVLAAHGIPYRVVPGITAALGAAACADIPLTHRRLARSVTFVSGQALLDPAFEWDWLTSAHHTLVVYMGVRELPLIVARLARAGVDPDLPAAIIERATLPEQRIVRGALASIAERATGEHVTAPALLILGRTAALAGEAPAVPHAPLAAAAPLSA